MQGWGNLREELCNQDIFHFVFLTCLFHVVKALSVVTREIIPNHEKKMQGPPPCRAAHLLVCEERRREPRRKREEGTREKQEWQASPLALVLAPSRLKALPAFGFHELHNSYILNTKPRFVFDSYMGVPPAPESCDCCHKSSPRMTSNNRNLLFLSSGGQMSKMSLLVAEVKASALPSFPKL
jgi:hypothetical protein